MEKKCGDKKSVVKTVGETVGEIFASPQGQSWNYTDRTQFHNRIINQRRRVASCKVEGRRKDKTERFNQGWPVGCSGGWQ